MFVGFVDLRRIFDHNQRTIIIVIVVGFFVRFGYFDFFISVFIYFRFTLQFFFLSFESVFGLFPYIMQNVFGIERHDVVQLFARKILQHIRDNQIRNQRLRRVFLQMDHPNM